jgi:hypothetical protein
VQTCGLVQGPRIPLRLQTTPYKVSYFFVQHFYNLNDGFLGLGVDPGDVGGMEDHVEDLPEYDRDGDPIVPVEHDLEADDIRLVFHPSAGIPEQYHHFDDYCGMESTPDFSGPPPTHGESDRPWRPFRTKLDFEIAEVMLDAHMNTAQTGRMLALIHDAVRCPETFTLVNLKHLSEIWDIARETRTEMVSNTTLG